MTIEEIFSIAPNTGGLHNLLDVHEAFFDAQGRFSLRLKVTEQLLNPRGAVHGGTLFALCDCAVGTYLASQQKWAVTLDSTVHFYRPGKPGDVLIAAVSERKMGRSVSTFLVEVWNQEERHIADATFTMYNTEQT